MAQSLGLIQIGLAPAQRLGSALLRAREQNNEDDGNSEQSKFQGLLQFKVKRAGRLQVVKFVDENGERGCEQTGPDASEPGNEQNGTKIQRDVSFGFKVGVKGEPGGECRANREDRYGIA